MKMTIFIFSKNFIFCFCIGFKVPSEIIEIRKIFYSFITERTIICF